MEKTFYEWLYRKYGWSEKDYSEIEKGDAPFAEDLMLEYYGNGNIDNRNVYERKKIYENSSVR